MEQLKMPCAALALSLLTTGCGIIPTSDDRLEFQGAYFRTNAAHEAFIGSIGLKRTELNNRFELKFTPVWDNLVLKNTTKFDLTLARQVNTSLGIEGNTAAPTGEVGVGTGTSSDAQSVDKYHLLRIADTKSLVEQLNDEKNSALRNYIKRSPKYRIITSVIIVYDHQSSKVLDNTANATKVINMGMCEQDSLYGLLTEMLLSK